MLFSVVLSVLVATRLHNGTSAFAECFPRLSRTMPKRSSTAAAACATAAALQALPSMGFLVPTTPLPQAQALLHRSGRTGLSKSQVHARSGSFSQGFGLEERPPATSAVAAAGRRSRRSHATRTSMVFGGGGGRGGGGFRLDPGTIATITFGLLFVFAPGFIFGAFNTLFLVRDGRAGFWRTAVFLEFFGHMKTLADLPALQTPSFTA